MNLYSLPAYLLFLPNSSQQPKPRYMRSLLPHLQSQSCRFCQRCHYCRTLACNRRWPVEGCNYDRPAYSGFGPAHNAKYRTDGSSWIDDAALQRTRLLPPSTRQSDLSAVVPGCEQQRSVRISDLGQNAGTPLPLPPAASGSLVTAPHRHPVDGNTATHRAGHSNTSGTNATASRACAVQCWQRASRLWPGPHDGAVGRRVIANSVCRRSCGEVSPARGCYVVHGDTTLVTTSARAMRCRHAGRSSVYVDAGAVDPGLLLLPASAIVTPLLGPG
jgi:hypothetical protein